MYNTYGIVNCTTEIKVKTWHCEVWYIKASTFVHKYEYKIWDHIYMYCILPTVLHMVGAVQNPMHSFFYFWWENLFVCYSLNISLLPEVG